MKINSLPGSYRMILDALRRHLLSSKLLTGHKAVSGPLSIASKVLKLTDSTVFDKRRRNPLWKLTEKLSGENHITKEAVDLFYAEVDGLIQQRIDEKRSGFNKVDQEGGVDLLELFMQTTEDKYTLGGMCFSFLAAGRESHIG